MRKYFIFFILIYLISATLVKAEVLTTTGFIPGQIWYSKSPLVEGDTVKIFTAIWNNSSTSSLTAKVEFYDKNVLLGSRDIVVGASGLKEVYISWKVTSGDHLISAKIISPSITASGKKEVLALDNYSTNTDSQFVPVVIKKVDGSPATSSDLIKSQIDKASSTLDSIVPKSVSTPVSENLGSVDAFRSNTFDKISENKIDTQNKLDLLNKVVDNKNPITTTNITNNKKTTEKVATNTVKSNTSDATEKPITYLKLFFLAILVFVFGSKIVFYSLIILIIFFVLRFMYRKIRNR